MFKKGTAVEEVSEFLREKIRKAGVKSKITIIDAYFFSNSSYSITNLLKNILEPFKNTISTIEIITVESKINNSNYERFKRDFSNYDIKVFQSDDFHDRFWIIDDSQAFIVGASINGIGKKHFFVQDDYLTQKDSDELLSLYKGEEL
ncbi:hypothetical protein FCU45_10850 [Sulfurimonas crateris]|uniref:PLD phosphodiesterase domain-containing protein n=1 Tax=Sulfurimonas crateris TaxID=2574727 RepID=A0A4U2Z516_9BACT|nr:hypothetical protein [Sulfurimonas crateris]TKI68502.1 hypothetical protein FCU45_10850 [Sulfurimonas crateris]